MMKATVDWGGGDGGLGARVRFVFINFLCETVPRASTSFSYVTSAMSSGPSGPRSPFQLSQTDHWHSRALHRQVLWYAANSRHGTNSLTPLRASERPDCVFTVDADQIEA